MKKTVKVLIAAVFAVGFGSLANAQSASISANATVISQLVVTNNANLNFGTVVVGQTKSIDAYETIAVSTGPTLGSANRGRFVVRAQQGSNVQLTFVLPADLRTAGGAILPISFDFDDQVAAVEDNDSGYTVFYPTDAYQITGFGDSPVNVWIGGKVDAATGVTAGTYTGTITLSATYN